MPSPPVVLASSSRYRRELLSRLLTQFDSVAPAVDETRLPDEEPAALSARLARAKAEAVAATVSDAIVIGSDQVAALGEQVLGKPGNAERALEQLLASSGRSVDFHTAVCVIGPQHSAVDRHVDLTTVHFRDLGEAELRRYLVAEQPFDCAGSFKSEGLGVTLMTRIDNEDPTALQGLPLIWLADCLRRLGMTLP
ncbi:MAG: Maf family nucleotide pyrophosphatase [Gammaproteobacteria bacterium]|nr:Maf family nucleotide pyrophosphatase [Gammaproteobacteria bacterium]